jgi:hypothetical protein
VLAAILFVSPWAFDFTAVTALAWSAWIIAILVVLALGSLVAMQNRRAGVRLGHSTRGGI